MRSVTTLLLALLLIGAAAQPPLARSASEILQDIQKLRVTGTVLYIAAHPDDENTRLISYLSKDKKLRVAYLSLTRGEGGQNLTGSEQGDALGLLRTQELLAARRIDGGLQFFTRAADFGYSKTPEETFQKWNRDSVLSDMVLVIRKLRPDVIICRFPTTGEGGHGHHTASAILALEAFSAAADKNRFPAQLRLYGTWQSKRIFWNTFNFGSTNTIGPGQFSLDVGGYNPLLGKSYGEIAAESRSMHKSQGFGSVKQRGSAKEYFKLLKGDSAGNDLFSGLDLYLSHSEAFTQADQLASRCIQTFDPSSPEKSLEVLSQLYAALSAIRSADAAVVHWKKIKLEECAALMADCAGLWMEATSTKPYGFNGEDARIDLVALCRSGAEVILKKVAVNDQSMMPSQTLLPQQSFTTQLSVRITKDMGKAGPFWTNGRATSPASFNSSDIAGTTAYPPQLTATFEVLLAGQTLTVSRPVQYKKGDPVKGEIYAPFCVLPPAEISFSDKVFVLANGEKKRVRMAIKALTDSVRGTLRIKGSPGISVSPYDSVVRLEKTGAEHVIDLEVEGRKIVRGSLSAELLSGGERYGHSVRWIEYDHVPRQLLTSPAEAAVVMPDLKKGISKVGYINGAGDEVVNSLKQMGYEVEIIETGRMDLSTLKKYEAVITGVRAFNTNEELHKKMPVLLDYVKDGGNLLIQYNTNSRVGPLQFAPGPYPFTISRQRVTDETAKIKFLLPEHAALNHPNKITAADFNNWVQERGIYFAEKADPRYEKLFSMNDPGEGQLDGSTIVAGYGKGNYIYTGLVFFRQLPAGVPGAYRLFANLLSLPGHEKE